MITEGAKQIPLTQHNGDVLAYIGDTVYQLMVQETLLRQHDYTAARFHSAAIRYLNHTFQSEAAERLLPALSEEEAAVFRRGRNVHQIKEKRSDPLSHARATGLEALFGYLWLSGRQQRLCELFALVMREERPEPGAE